MATVMNASGKILLVDSDIEVQALLRGALEREGFQVIRCLQASAAVALCYAERPALVLLEASFPDGDGFAVCEQLRGEAALAATPAVFLTSRASEADRLRGLECGAIDYVTKPFSPRELVARIKAHLRSRPQNNGALRVGAVELDSSRCRVHVNGSEVALREMEFRLLEYFMRNEGHVLSRQRLLSVVWPPGDRAQERTVDVYVARLRAKIEFAPGSGVFFRSVRGFGYSLEIARPGWGARTPLRAMDRAT